MSRGWRLCTLALIVGAVCASAGEGAWARIASRSGPVTVTRRTAPADDWRLLLIDTTATGDLRGLGFGTAPQPGERFAVGDTRGYLGVFEVTEVATKGCDGAHYYEATGRMVSGPVRDPVGDRVAVGPVRGPMTSLRVELTDSPTMAEAGDDAARPLVAVHLDEDRRPDLGIFAVECPSAHDATASRACLETRARQGRGWRRVALMAVNDCR